MFEPLGTAPIAGALGFINQEQKLITFSQDVEFNLVDPARDLITLNQEVIGKDHSRTLISFRQNVLQAGTLPTDEQNLPPAGYVSIDGVPVEHMTARDSVTVSHAEDANSTASILVFSDTDAQIDIPSFHGKSITISAHLDPTDASSQVVPLFTGYVETAKYDRARRGVAMTCTDLRERRLGDQIAELSSAGYYSKYAQARDVEGKELAREYLRTMTYSCGYGRDGLYYQREWGVSGKAPVLTLLDEDVAYEDIETEFQNRSGVINSVKIKGDYRYHRLHSFIVNIEARRDRIINTNTSAGFVAKQDVQTFSSDSMADRANSFQPWETITYDVIPASQLATGTRVINGQTVQGTVETTGTLEGRAVGFRATIRRRIAQPVLQQYEYTLSNADSIANYGEQEGSQITFSVDTEFERDRWEDNGYVFGATGDPNGLTEALRSVYMMGRKQMLESHRRNYITTTTHRIIPIDIGQIVEHDNRMLTVTGQVSALTYTIADGVRDTEIRLSCSYFDGPITAYTPGTPYVPDTSRYVGLTPSLSGSTGYNDGILEAEAPEIPELYTNEQKPTAKGEDQSVIIENQPITLINGY